MSTYVTKIFEEIDQIGKIKIKLQYPLKHLPPSPGETK